MTSDLPDSDVPAVAELSADESWELLHAAQFGRLAVVIGGAPEIFPINVAAKHPSIYFRTAEGTKLFGTSIGHAVAFESDRVDGSGAWSVVVKGTSREVTTRDETDAVDALGLESWVPTVKHRLVAIDVTSVSGRRFAFGPAPDDDAVEYDPTD